MAQTSPKSIPPGYELVESRYLKALEDSTYLYIRLVPTFSALKSAFSLKDVALKAREEAYKAQQDYLDTLKKEYEKRLEESEKRYRKLRVQMVVRRIVDISATAAGVFVLSKVL